MDDTQPTAAAPSKPKSHHPTRVMVDNAVRFLNERNGSSLVSIKKYIVNTYNVDLKTISHRIKKYIRDCLNSGKYVKTTGKGIAGSFKISSTYKETGNTKIKTKRMELKRKLTNADKSAAKEKQENDVGVEKTSSAKKNPQKKEAGRKKQGIRV